ncbi:MAG TPA: transporter, partial [Steroidobacteraceae bacterium]
GAQELEPRAYSPSPVGLNFVLFAGSRSTGEILPDPSVPIENIEATIDAGVAGYGRTFALWGQSASVAVAVPYVWGDVSGDVGEERRAVTRDGLGDVRLRLATNLLGGPALTPKEFMQRTPRSTLGASLVVIAPTGQYYSDKLINIGTNRWAFKPELGFSMPHNRWMFDVYAGLWLFTDNDEFFGGVRRSQDPITTIQGHVSYTIRPRLWIALDSTYYFGGQSTVDGVLKADRKENSRLGVTFSLPIGARQSIKASWSEGASTRTGNDFSTWGVAWQYAWFD